MRDYFEFCMAQEVIWRKAEYSTDDHSKKAKCHRMRWYWMDKAVICAQA